MTQPVEDKSTEQKRLGLSLVASLAAHALLVALIAWQQFDKPLPKAERSQVMDVVLLDPDIESAYKAPDDAQTYSNKSATGSSADAKDHVTRAAKSPAPGPSQDKPKPQPNPRPKSPPPLPQKTQEKRMRLLTKRGVEPTSNPSDTPRRPKEMPTKPVPFSSLLPSSQALAELSRDFERERRLKQMLSKEADIPVNTREAKFAPYTQSLVSALEEQWRPGKARYNDYTDNERRVLMRVTIHKNGALGKLEVLQPSPLRSLTESAINAVHAAAPFKPLPSSWGLDSAKFYFSFEVVEDRFVFRAQ